MAEITVHYDGPIVTRLDAKAAGLKWYFTGKPCSRGHVDRRLVSNWTCRRCANDHTLRYEKTDAGKLRVARGGKKYGATARGRASAIRRTKKYASTERGRISVRLQSHVRRIRKRDADQGFTSAEFQKLVESQKKCHICGRRFTKNEPPTIDHVVPLARGGLHIASNIALAHKRCNARKYATRTHLV